MDTAEGTKSDDEATAIRAEVIDILRGAVVKLLIEGRVPLGVVRSHTSEKRFTLPAASGHGTGQVLELGRDSP